jgi:hypothetical protein
MPDFTCITEVRDSFHVSQHRADGAEQALRRHIAALPFDDGTGPFDEELEWLQRISNGQQAIELLPMHGCKATWLWGDGARHDPKYITYIVRTAVD